MIQRIDSIKDFGIFKNYLWSNNPDIPDFKEKNILYGWNYSGKTTLSRIFSSLRDQTLLHDFPAALFKLTCDQVAFDQTNLSVFPYKVAVFNAEYAKDNLRWEYDEHINAIFFEVGDNAKISAQIVKLSTMVEGINGSETIKGKKEKHQAAIDEYNRFEVLYTQEAGRIKNDAFVSLIEFNKGHLKKVKDKILANLDDHIIISKDELTKISKTVKVEEPRPPIANINFQTAFHQILEATNVALAKIPSKSQVLTILDKNTGAYEWAKIGLSLHTRKDNCFFCGNEIDEDRYNALVKYFENESSQLKLEITEILKLIAFEIRAIEEISIPSSVNDLNDGFQEEFLKKESTFIKESKKYKTILDKIASALRRKATEKIYTKIDGKFKETTVDSFLKSVEQVKELITHNNEFIDNFEETIQRERYKSHLVALFLKQSNYVAKVAKFDKAVQIIKELNLKIDRYNAEIKRLNASKESDGEGCVQFNSFVQSFLSRNDIKIELNGTTKKFNLMRDGVLAQNLSEGEKMAISFSHFLVSLKSIEQKGKLKDYIVYIDDPISSLDSNHIFQINSLLKDTFFKLVTDSLNPKNPMWQIQCRQLFISTHNFEFFTLLKELPKKSYKKDSRYFFTRKLTESVIEKLPNVYNTFSSEYHYLFGEILSFTKEQNKGSSNRLLIIPNIVRRFVEMYTLTKYPSNEEVDTRAEIVFGKRESKRILKLLHHFSHFNSIDRIHKHSEFVADIEHACNDVIKLIKENDKLHYDALEASLS